jgi:chemotaxis protein methyltransferase CheR
MTKFALAVLDRPAGVLMNTVIRDILYCLRAERGLDFSGYRLSMVERRVAQRASGVGCGDLPSYLGYLSEHPDELDNLADVLTINVSRFFRNPLTFEYLASKILPRLVYEKKQQGDFMLRIWSAGCSFGEEAYSIAILIREILDREDLRFDVRIFATDIDQGALKKAGAAVYPYESVKEVKFGLLKRYFVPAEPENKGAGTENESFQLVPEIRDIVSFSTYDILTRHTFAPPESIFGSFDMVLCRNLLIYFNPECQNAIMEKLFRTLRPAGYLILGEAEVPTPAYRKSFNRVDGCCHVYQKA